MNENDLDTTRSWIDDDDAPEWTEEMFARAELRVGGKVVRPATGTITKPGRPRLTNPKRQITLRIDPDVLDHFRASGRGWQSRINEVLRRSMAS